MQITLISDLAVQYTGVPCALLHWLQRSKARIGTNQQGRKSQISDKRQGTNVICVLGSPAWHPWAQRQLLTAAVTTRVDDIYQLFLGKAVFHCQGVRINLCVATGRGTEVNGLSCKALLEQPVTDLRYQDKPLLSKGFETLTQGGAHGHMDRIQRTLEEFVAPAILFWPVVALAHAQQPNIGLENIVDGGACLPWKRGIDQEYGRGELERLYV